MAGGSVAQAGLAAPGGAFLVEPAGLRPIFAPEDFDEEQRGVAREAQRFMDKEVIPRERRLESKEGKAQKEMVAVLRKAGELGFCLVEVPEAYGGLGSDKRTALLLCEKLGANGDFSVSYGAHCGIGLAPLLLFGTVEQKKRYAEKIGSAEFVSCYALSEPGSGSDALAARTTAVLDESGEYYVLNGTKQWITNAAWMDVGIVFAKVDGDKFTAFIVERGTAGFSHGGEEHKLGLRGSSTCQLILDGAKVPKANVLGEVGKGHLVAFNTLNLGRFKLGASVIGGAKRVLADALGYAKDRKQFRTAVADFGAIREMVADSTVQIFLGEALNYRIAGMIDERIAASDPLDTRATMAAVEEYVIESSISKVYSSEALDRITDRAFQWYGGYGFTEDYPVEKMYRDARVNRIFEGTNEINRLLVPGTLVKRIMQGRPSVDAAMADLEARSRAEDLPGLPTPGLARAHWALQRLKWIALTIFQAATDKHGVGLDKEQEALIALANLIIDCYAVDSAIARTEQRMAKHGERADSDAVAICLVASAEALDRGVVSAWRQLEAMYEGDALTPWAERLNRLSAHLPGNVVAWKRQIAATTVAAGRYALSDY